MQLLLITAHFPSYDYPGETYATPFLFQYAEQWAKMGHDVHIVHFARNYPILFKFLAKLSVLVGSKRLVKYSYSSKAMQDSKYDYCGVHITRYKYLKYIPHGKTNRIISGGLIRKVKNQLINEEIKPDYIIGDCLDPVVDVICELSKKYCCPKYQIIHGTDISWFKDKETRKKIEELDMLLLRSQQQKKDIEKQLGEFRYKYMYSGITEDQLDHSPTFRYQIKELLYVGALYKSKGLETILQAVSKTNNEGLFLRIIGDGIDKDYFEKKIKELNICEKVMFIGKVPHENVFSYMKDADALVLISHETFGMVYVEAMSQGCIPIGTVNEGIDGVVRNGENGFLSPLDDVNALTMLFNSFGSRTKEEIEMISRKAYNTAKEMTIERLAAGFFE